MSVRKPESKEEPQDKVHCFFCEAVVPNHHLERDHWPVSKKFGGRVTIDSCGTCHHMKDRTNIRDWPINWFVRAASAIDKLQFLWETGLSREERIFLAKSLQIILDNLDTKQNKPGEIIDSLNDYVIRFFGTPDDRERLDDIARSKRKKNWKK
tara:strand:+ start:195 stop:653 length:459 start_codon:yes stop_codon:yes gene_type:complete